MVNMLPRDVIVAYLCQLDGMRNQIDLRYDDMADALIGRLKDNGLFIGPIVATPEMAEAGQGYKPKRGDWVWRSGKASWDAMVEEWQRGEGE